MKDPFKTHRMKTGVHGLPTEIESQGPASPPGQGPLSTRDGGPDSWSTDRSTNDRDTDPVLAIPTNGLKDRATLTVLSGINAGQVFALDHAEYEIGRGTEADIWIEDGGVSRKHAILSHRSDGRFFVEDCGSTNGTFVGTQRIKVSELRSGDRIQLGPNVLLRFAITDDREDELQRRLYESSTRDPLTRLYNRKYFTERLSAEVAFSTRHKVKLAVLMIDLDDFKAMNDTYGHLAGDMILRAVGAQMQRLVRVEDLVARYGGEEFVILARSTGKTAATQLAERVRQAIANVAIPFDDTALRVTASIGVAALQDVAPDGGPTELLVLADERLYRAKAEGKNRVCTDGPSSDGASS